MPFPAAPPLSVSVSDRATLRAIARAPTSEQRAVTRARIVLRSAEAVAIERIAAELGVAVMTVKLWRRRYSEQGLIGLVEERRSGRPPTYTREDRDRVIAFTLSEPPPGTTHWSARRLGERLGMSETTVWRIWRSANLEAPPRRDVQVEHRSGARGQGARRRGALPRAARAGDRVERRWEDLRSEALDRTQPMLPLRPGQVERHTHDDTRHGVTSLFAALNVATGEVTQESRQRHTGADFLAFLRRIERAYPGQDLHVVLDNVSTHKTPAVRAWLQRHPRVTLHFTPTSASWMNQIETWFGILTRQAIRRGSFGSVKELVAKIDTFTRHWNAGATPFLWVKSADEILAKAVRKPTATSESRH